MTQRKHSKNRRWNQDAAPLTAVTFDVTHTLIHAPHMAEIYSEVLCRHGVSLSSADLRRKIPQVWKEFSCRADMRCDRFGTHPNGARGWWHDFVARLCRHCAAQEPSRFASAELFSRFAQPESWEVYVDVVPILRDLLAAGLRLGVISNWDHRLPRLLQRLGLAEYFSVITYSAEIGCEKPHPQIFQHCLQTLGVRPEQALHVGDSAIEDGEGAMATGMRSLLVDRRSPRVSFRKLLGALLNVSSLSPGRITGPVDRAGGV